MNELVVSLISALATVIFAEIIQALKQAIKKRTSGKRGKHRKKFK